MNENIARKTLAFKILTKEKIPKRIFLMNNQEDWHNFHVRVVESINFHENNVQNNP